MLMNDAKEIEAFERLLGVCRRLRGPDGCPWDREQTLESMTPYLLEEAAEVGQAVAEGAPEPIAEELGDHVFLGIFCLEVLRERAGIGLAESLDRAAEKLVRRHPHVYGGAPVRDGGAAYHQWQQLKKQEHGGSLLGGQPPGLAALVAAYRSQEKASAVGFDWPEASGPLAKVREEVEEIALEIDRSDARASAREVGDLLFAVVNLARHLGVDPERELASATRRFRERFHHIERRLAEQGRSFKGTALSELDALWEEAKSLARPKENP
jgi:tetrapyrrole methylase family protein/MazG family protein